MQRWPSSRLSGDAPSLFGWASECDSSSRQIPLANPSHHDTSELFADAGFALTRSFLWILLSAFAVLGAAAAVLAWHFRMDVSVKAEGVLMSAVRHTAKPQVPGVISEVHVAHGALVRAGQRLVTLDDLEWRSQLEKVDGEIAIVRSRTGRLEARLASDRGIAEDEMEVAAIEAERAALEVRRVRLEHSMGHEAVNTLLGWRRQGLDDLIPVRRAQVVLDQKRALWRLAGARRLAHDGREREVEELQRELEKLMEERRRLERRIGQSVLRAPMDGMVLTPKLAERRGDRVDAGETVVEVGSPDTWVVQADIDETGITRVRVGLEARIEVTAFPHMEYQMLHGEVASIGVRATPSGYPVRIALDQTSDTDSEGYEFLEGMTATVRIIVERGRVLELLWREALRALGRINPDALHLPAAGVA